MPNKNYDFKVLLKNTQKTSRQPATKQILNRNCLFQFSEICLITLKSLFSVICGGAFINLTKQQVHERQNQRGQMKR